MGAHILDRDGLGGLTEKGLFTPTQPFEQGRDPTCVVPLVDARHRTFIHAMCIFFLFNVQMSKVRLREAK